MPRATRPDPHLAFVETILWWFAREGRSLPWRERGAAPWGILVSEVMLQQTPVSRVLPVWTAWMTRWPTPGALAGAAQADAVRAWGRLGYPRRAQRLWECAAAIEERFGGRVPSDEATLRELPGIGEYTAAAVAAFAFGRRAVVLDTNVRRVLARIVSGVAVAAPHLTGTERALAAEVVPVDPATSVTWNAAAMELGALVCTSRAPRCDACPASDWCRWLAAGRPAATAPRRVAQSWAGSDRQVRGRILALLRAATFPVNVAGSAALEDVEPGQLDRCLEGLLEDGLVRLVSQARGTYEL
jgi:A/G-specific adenine glycosylase